ncbi:MAG: hypothetical protein COA83_03385 [Methylophaga sp.]|nr:MAG: hypothetical protein COA83_03385 [Methylophaga sp.]
MSIYLKIIGSCLFVILSSYVHAAPQKPYLAIDADLILLPSPDANTIKSFPIQSFRDLPVFGSHKLLTSDTYSKQELRMLSLNANETGDNTS